jgi:hypothetical protein
MNLVNEFYSKLKHDKIELNWNKNPIPMSKFLSFLAIPTERSTDHLGSSTGWTLHFNTEAKLRVGGAIYGGIEWLNRVEYGTNMMNPYNNYVNPFFIFDILTEEGKVFFVDYYAKEIDEILSSLDSSVQSLKQQLIAKEGLQKEVKSEVNQLRSIKRG